MGNGRHAREGADDGFDRAWMKGIEEDIVRLAWPAKLPEDRVRGIAQEVAIALWQRSRRSGDPAIPDDLTRIIEFEIRKELRAFEREQALPARAAPPEA